MSTLVQDKPRFLNGIWNHLFIEHGRQVERPCSICFDRETGEMVDMMIERNRAWIPANQAEKDEVVSSIVIANEEALENPSDWDLEESHEPNMSAEAR